MSSPVFLFIFCSYCWSTQHCCSAHFPYVNLQVSLAVPASASPLALPPPSDCLLVGMQAWTPIVRSCLSALYFFFFHLPLHLPHAIPPFSFQLMVSTPSIKLQHKAKASAGGRGLLRADKWIGGKGRKGYGLLDKGMFPLKGRLKKAYNTPKR